MVILKQSKIKRAIGANALAAMSAVAVALFYSSAVSSMTSSGSIAHAANSPAKVTVSVDEACSLSGETGDTPHTLTNPTIGAWNAGIGTTNVTAICNDNGGYDIYAVGYSGDEWKNTNLINTSDSSITIGTRDYDSGYTSSSYWSMQLSQGTGDKATIVSPYDNYSAIPSDYTKVATYPSNTTGASGSSFKTTYGIYLTNTQTPGTYQGQVKYTLVHPNGAEAPEIPKPTLQNLDLAQCAQNVGSNGNPANVGDEITITDSRDGKSYTVRYINGACWMTQNLAIEPGTKMTADDTNITDVYTDANPYTLPGSGYDLRANGSSGDKCYGYSTTGMGYSNSCTHIANSIDVSESNSSACDGKICTTEQLGAWYNYAAATAGTISDTANDSVDVYNICPKGWTLPSSGTNAGQIGSIGYTYKDSFKPIYGGYYFQGTRTNINTYGYWWSTAASGSYSRYYLYYGSGFISTDNRNFRSYGQYIRCVRTT